MFPFGFSSFGFSPFSSFGFSSFSFSSFSSPGGPTLGTSRLFCCNFSPSASLSIICLSINRRLSHCPFRFRTQSIPNSRHFCPFRLLFRRSTVWSDVQMTNIGPTLTRWTRTFFRKEMIEESHLVILSVTIILSVIVKLQHDIF